MPVSVLHVLLYISLCLVPGLILLPLRFLDREPDNANRQNQGSEPGDQAEMILAA